MKKIFVILLILVISISLFSCDLFKDKDEKEPTVDPVNPTDPTEEETVDPLNEYYKAEYKTLYDEFPLYYQRCENAGLENAIDNDEVYAQYMDQIYTDFQKKFTYDENDNSVDYYSQYISLQNFYATLETFIADPITFIDEYNKEENGEYEQDVIIETNGIWPYGSEYFFNEYIPPMSSVTKFTLVFHKDDFYSYEIEVPNVTEEDFENYRNQIIQNLAIHFDIYSEYNVYYATYSTNEVDITFNLQLTDSTLKINIANFIYD